MRLLLVTFCLALISCSTPRPTGKTEAEVLYKEAQDLMKESRYILATEKLNTIRSQYPYSFYATHAELLQADILFNQESFVEAAAAYILFKDFHPKHAKKAYVTFRIAESFFAQIPDTFDRDLSAAHEAVKYYQELLNFHEKSEYTKGGIEKIKLAQAMILNKEKYIGDFYFKTKVFDAARYRYLSIIDRFRNEPDLLAHSMIRVIESSHKLKEKEICTKYYNQYKEQIDQSQIKKLRSVYNNCVR